MAKRKPIFVCRECGNESPRWMGQCQACQAWNSFTEEMPPPESVARIPLVRRTNGSRPVRLREVDPSSHVRLETGVSEIDRVLGGGIVRVEAILIGGSPGIG